MNHLFKNSSSLVSLVSLACAVSAPAAVLINHTFDGVTNDMGELIFQSAL